MSGVAIFIIFVNLLLAFKLWWDSRAKNSGRIINHGLSAVIDGLLYILSSVLLIYLRDDYSLSVAAGAVLCAASWRWILFDAIFAKIHWGQWIFYGKSSKLDIFMKAMQEIFGKWHLVIKLIPAMIAIALILI